MAVEPVYIYLIEEEDAELDGSFKRSGYYLVGTSNSRAQATLQDIVNDLNPYSAMLCLTTNKVRSETDLKHRLEQEADGVVETTYGQKYDFRSKPRTEVKAAFQTGVGDDVQIDDVNIYPTNYYWAIAFLIGKDCLAY